MEKQHICDAIMKRDEEWLIIAIKKLLDLDEEENFSPAHHQIVADRLAAYEADPSNTITLEELEKDFKESGKI